MNYLVKIFCTIFFLLQLLSAGSSEKKSQFSAKQQSLPDTGGISLPSSSTSEHSSWLAVGLSIILPGAGEYYLGHKRSAVLFAGLDMVFWSAYGYNAWNERSTIRDYHNYGREFAGISSQSYDDTYWIQVGKYNDIYSNNSAELINRRLDLVYNNINDYYWQWQSESQRLTYNKLRDEAHTYNRRKSTFIVGLIANRLVSAFNVIRILKNQKQTGSMTLLNVNPVGVGQGRKVMMVSILQIF